MKNPFEFGRELGANELVDREAEIAEVVETIRRGGKLFIIGPRRYGKTSILKAAEDRLTEDGAALLRFDAETYASLDLLASAIVAETAKRLKGSVERVGEQVRKFFSRLRPELSFSVAEREWTAKLGVNVSETGTAAIGFLVEALNGFEELAKAQSASRAVGLVIDEFQKIIEIGGQAAEAQIRAAIQRHKRAGYVFAGSKTRLLTKMTMEPARPFYRLGQLRFVGPLPRKDFREFLVRHFAESKFTVESPAIDFILDVAEEVPYNVQMLAHSCWAELRTRTSAAERALSRSLVGESLERLVRQYDPFYTQLWTALTAVQQKTLRAVIVHGGANLQSMKVVHAIGKGASTVRRSLGALVDRGILREDESGGVTRLRFEDPFFAHWIRMFTEGGLS